MAARGSISILLGVLVALAACGGSPPSRFYLLSPIANPASLRPVAARDKNLALAIGPIALPKHLDRSQFVTRASANRIQLAEFDRWAEPLFDNFARVLVENLSGLVGTERIVVHSAARAFPIDYQILIDVSRFEAVSSRNVILVARWRIYHPKSDKILKAMKSTSSQPITGPGYEGMAAAMSIAVGELSRDIAKAINSLKRKGG